MCICENEELIEKLHDQFDDELEILLDKWSDKIPSYNIVLSFMREIRIASCFDDDCYYQMLGHLTHMLTNNLENLFEDIQKYKHQELAKEEVK